MNTVEKIAHIIATALEEHGFDVPAGSELAMAMASVDAAKKITTEFDVSERPR